MNESPKQVWRAPRGYVAGAAIVLPVVWAWCVIGTALTASKSGPWSDDALATAAVVGVPAALLTSYFCRSRVEVMQEAVVIVRTVRRFTIPWNRVRSVSVNHRGLPVVTRDDGRAIAANPVANTGQLLATIDRNR